MGVWASEESRRLASTSPSRNLTPFLHTWLQSPLRHQAIKHQTATAKETSEGPFKLLPYLLCLLRIHVMLLLQLVQRAALLLLLFPVLHSSSREMSLALSVQKLSDLYACIITHAPTEHASINDSTAASRLKIASQSAHLPAAAACCCWC